MLKSIRTFILSGLVVLLCAGGAAAAVADVNGELWMQSTNDERLSFLYGASTIIAIETLASQQAKETTSIFTQKWMEIFGKDDLQTLNDKLTNWYIKHPKQRNRGVFDVLWYEFMAPGTQKKQE